jgi:hypothetical protein
MKKIAKYVFTFVLLGGTMSAFAISGIGSRGAGLHSHSVVKGCVRVTGVIKAKLLHTCVRCTESGGQLNCRFVPCTPECRAKV